VRDSEPSHQQISQAGIEVNLDDGDEEEEDSAHLRTTPNRVKKNQELSEPAPLVNGISASRWEAARQETGGNE
jgi:hypothetical protein